MCYACDAVTNKACERPTWYAWCGWFVQKGLRVVKPALHGVCTSIPGVELPQFHASI
jgi:hypothetical protein